MIFADYWVCTVLTTVGYGDYAAATSLEYCFTIGLEFLGIVVFSVLQIAMLKIVKLERNFGVAISGFDYESLCFMQRLEKS